jgi:hypothetical protein
MPYGMLNGHFQSNSLFMERRRETPTNEQQRRVQQQVQ